MKVKVLDSSFYIGQEPLVGKVFTAIPNEDYPDLLKIKGADLISAGASQDCFDSQWTYNFALCEDVEIVEDENEG